MSMLCRLRLCRLVCAAIGLTGLWSILPAGSQPARAQAAPPQDATQEMSEDELRLRVELLRQHGYAEHAARQACGAGDLWAADRIEQDRASPSERDRYNR
jgi:hypothetical protein